MAINRDAFIRKCLRRYQILFVGQKYFPEVFQFSLATAAQENINIV